MTLKFDGYSRVWIHKSRRGGGDWRCKYFSDVYNIVCVSVRFFSWFNQPNDFCSKILHITLDEFHGNTIVWFSFVNRFLCNTRPFYKMHNFFQSCETIDPIDLSCLSLKKVLIFFVNSIPAHLFHFLNKKKTI